MAAPDSAGFKFGRGKKLKARRDFERARKRGARTTCGCLIVNWIRPAESETTRLGVITPRNVGPAVVRNRARRLLRETFRIHQNQIEGPLDLIVVARQSIAEKSFSEVERDFLAAARKARILKVALA